MSREQAIQCSTVVRWPRLAHLLLLIVALVLVSVPARGQQICPAAASVPDGCPSWESEPLPGWQAHALGLGLNAAIGGVTAGIARELHGGSFWEGFRTALAGGSVHYAGKVIGSRRFAAAGLLGRQVAALGGSMVHNAASGRRPLDRLVAPLGPIRLYVDRNAPRPVRAKLDLLTAVGAAYALAHGGGLDAQASFSSGALVFLVPDDFDAWSQRAAAVGGVIIHRERLQSHPDRAWILAHERVHTMQHDLGLAIWSEPAESWLTSDVLGGPFAALGRRVDLGLYKAIQHSLTWYFVPIAYNPWEQEAVLLGAR